MCRISFLANEVLLNVKAKLAIPDNNSKGSGGNNNITNKHNGYSL